MHKDPGSNPGRGSTFAKSENPKKMVLSLHLATFQKVVISVYIESSVLSLISLTEISRRELSLSPDKLHC